LKWVGMEEKKAYGGLLVHRFLEKPHTGVRLKVSHTFEGPFFKLRLLLDDKPVKDFPLQAPGSREVEITGKQFSEVGLQFVVAVSDVFPFKWRADVENIEVFRSDTGWVPVCDVAAGEPDLEGIVHGDDVVSTDGGDAGGSGGKSPGCAAAGAAGGSGWLLLVAAMAAGLLLLRRGSGTCT